MLTIHPQYLSLAKLCDGRLFRIPQYQRAYSWTSQQREDLFGDILKTHSKGEDASHFMAAVVCLNRGKQTLGTDEYQVMDVVDGQQRLTTLIILLQVIRLALDANDKAENKLATELSDLLVKVESDELLLLQTNHDSSHYFANFLRTGHAPDAAEAKTIADRQMLSAVEECRAFVAAWKAGGSSPLTLAALLKNRLFFLLHEINEEKTVYTVFEVLNSRGLDVSWLDRLKSILMGEAFELKNANAEGVIEDLHRTWRDIYSTIGLRQGLSTEALRFAATLRSKYVPRRPLGEEDAVDALREQAKTAKSIRETANWLLRVADACDAVLGNRRVNAVTRISQARLLATAIFLRNDLTEDARLSLLRRWERVAFRTYGMFANDARHRVGEYVHLAWRIVNQEMTPTEIDNSLADLGADFPIEEAVAKLRNENCYHGWERELRYLLYRYEEHLAKVQHQNFSNEQWEKIWMSSASDSIEHIWSRSKAPSAQKHRLGNLVLLPPKLNSKLQDKSPKEKASAYRKTGLLIAGEVADVIEATGWSSKAIAEREEQILQWAAREWAD